MDLGRPYLQARTATAQRLLDDLVRELLPKPMIEVHGPGAVEVVLNRQSGRLLAHLVNVSGPHEDESVYTVATVDPLGPLEVVVRPGVDRKPLGVTLEPGGRKVAWKWRDGEVRAAVPRVDLHEILVLDWGGETAGERRL